MAIDYDQITAYQVPEFESTYDERDTMLYALGLGLGADPLDTQQLKYVYEDDLEALPTMAVCLAWLPNWLPKVGVNYLKVLHGEQRLELHRPLPTAATVVARHRVVDVFDKGADKGALVISEQQIFEKQSMDQLCTITSTTFARGDGGFGGKSGPAPQPHAMPEGEPEAVCDLTTVPQAALIYRLSGDRNPLHADPAVADKAGFGKPILHGLCTYGVAGHAVLKTMCDYDPSGITGLDVRFSAPVYPGETIRTEMWRDGKVVSFRSTVLERDLMVLNNGKATLA